MPDQACLLCLGVVGADDLEIAVGRHEMARAERLDHRLGPVCPDIPTIVVRFGFQKFELGGRQDV